MIVCTFCRTEIPNPTAHGTYRLVQGWTTNRDAGGTNALVGETLTDPPRYACHTCIKVDRAHLRKASDGEQMELI